MSDARPIKQYKVEVRWYLGGCCHLWATLIEGDSVAGVKQTLLYEAWNFQRDQSMDVFFEADMAVLDHAKLDPYVIIYRCTDLEALARDHNKAQRKP